MATQRKKSTKADQRPIEDRPPCQLYLITPPVIDDLDAFCIALEAALAAAPEHAPISCLQIRLKDKDNKAANDSEIVQAASRITPLCHAVGTKVLINDRPDLVEACGADGVHIGQDDMDYFSSKELLGPDAIIGVTCHNSRELAFKATEQGADYVAFGAFYDTATKTPKFRAEPEILQWWQDTIETPCVAIGGITPQNADALIQAGADFIAVSNAVWMHPKGPAAAVKAFYALF